jgi:pilus assembly protein Flp/PilA
MEIKQELHLSKLNAINWCLCHEAQGLVEYALIIILVALIVLVLLAIFGEGVGNMFSNIMSNI